MLHQYGEIYDVLSLQSEPIYEEIPAQNTREQFVYDELIYAEIDGFGDDDSLSSVYFSIKELRAQRKPVDPLHICAKVDLGAKRKAKEQAVTPSQQLVLNDEHIYEEIDHFRESNNSLGSGYFSIEECAA
ncbi:hypothetical protein [Wolbachia pipientis]|uniref:hypothetical protein n=1 Tax=Wolbachia pipientis TaxID=955 RepID=UPI0025A36AB9|nr:hypothetical protein [Wolbachia pipientis]MDM8335043.1 hypothetical protein [Wolbachia pipientis]